MPQVNLKEKYPHIVKQYKNENERDCFSSYILGCVTSIVNEGCYTKSDKIKRVKEVLELKAILQSEIWSE